VTESFNGWGLDGGFMIVFWVLGLIGGLAVAWRTMNVGDAKNPGDMVMHDGLLRHGDLLKHGGPDLRDGSKFEREKR
jgi:hypothetical protein